MWPALQGHWNLQASTITRNKLVGLEGEKLKMTLCLKKHGAAAQS